MLTVFWDSQGVVLVHFQKRRENVNSAFYSEVSLKLQDAVHGKVQTIPASIQPEQPRREFNNYSGNFLDILLTARTWALMTSISLVL
jgi:hypothetical protein